MSKLVTDYLDASSVLYPDKVAFGDSIKQLSYAELQYASYHVADYLIKEGVNKSPVAIFMEKNVDCVASFFGVAYSGNFYSMLDINAPDERIFGILQNLDPKIIITNLLNKEKLSHLADRYKVVLYEDLIKREYDEEIVKIRKSQIRSTDVLYVIYTSGSTGAPKGVVTSHRAVVDYIEAATKDYLNFTQEDIFGNQYPFFYIASIDDIYLPVRNGSQTQIIPPQLFYSPLKLVNYLIEKKINVINWVPSALALIANYNALDQVDISNIKKVIFGGEPIAVKVLNYWRKALPNAVFINGYGATETTEGTTYYIIERDFEETEVIPLGKPLDNVDIFLLDENDKEVEKGRTGELCVHTSALSYGYYKDLEKTREVFVQDPRNKNYVDIIYRTGDIAYQDEDGNFVYLGRKDSQIKRYGHRIELGDIEKNVLEHRLVDECICLFKKETDELNLFYSGKINKDELSQYLRKKLPNFMLPSKYIRLEKLPTNANGKIDRNKLQEYDVEGGAVR